MRLSPALLLLLLLSSLANVQADEWWAWTWLETWHHGKNTVGLFLANRYDTENLAIMQLASPRLKRKLAPWLEGSLGFSLLQLKELKSDEHFLQGRPELELNPHFQLTDHWQLDWRNRMEWRRNESESLKGSRLRHRLQLGWTLPEALGPLTRLFVSNEWLIDLKRHQWAENRVVPLGLTFKTSPHTDLDLFYMLVSTKPKENWQNESIIGTYLRVKF